jgi:PKD repeat protein
MLQRYFLILTCLLSYHVIIAQDWVRKMNDPSVNFYDVQSAFDRYWKKEVRKDKVKNFFSFGNKTEEKNEGLILYNRWAHFVEPRVYPSGDRSLLINNALELEKTLTNRSYKSSRQAGGNWQPLGSFNVPTSRGGAGRLNCIRFHPTNTNIIYAGAPVGGLWISTTGGSGWTTNTDGLPTLGVNDVAVDPVDPNVMYLATGDMDASDSYGIGVLKSTDAGLTWNITGLNTSLSQGRYVSKILISPNDHNMVFASTSLGLFKSVDAGITWTKTLSSNPVRDMEFKPGDPTVIYAVASKTLYKSTNSGDSFLPISTGLPGITAVNRAAIAVTAADPSYIYVVYSDASTNGFYGFYRSTNSGASFTLIATSPNLLGWDTSGGDNDGQGWYTLSIAASPTNKNEVMVGGVNIWKTGNGGSSWDLVGHWYGGGGAPYVHADIHDLVYRPDGSACYASCDGGIFETLDGGFSWQDRSDGLQIGQMYRLGCSATNADIVIQGWQDNGTNLYNNGNWDRVMGGDGFECFVDWSNPDNMFGEVYYGAIERSTNGGASFHDIKNNITEEGDWNTPWQQDPIDPLTLYAGYKNVWKSTDLGNNWTQISSFGSSNLKQLVVAPSDPNYIYVTNGNTINKTTDGGLNWNTVTYPLAGTNPITYIAVSTTDPNKIWITRSGFSPDSKVYKSDDGGATWTNLTEGLPNIPANCVVNQTGTNDGIYVGTDAGVYYRDNNNTAWFPYSNGLPNTVITELEIQYAAGKLRAATYGRGLWESAIFNPASTLPFANFTADTLSGCPGLTVQFTDSSTNSPTGWNWSFPGGTPSTSTLQNPVITYNNPGTYNHVKLVVTNGSGVDSVTKTSYIAISPQIIPTITLNNNDSICTGTSLQLKGSHAQYYSWVPTGQTSYMISVNTTGVYSVNVRDIFNCMTSSAPVNIYVFPDIPAPIVTVSGDTLFSSAMSGNQWYLNGSAISGATGNYYLMTTVGGSYHVVASDSMGLCSGTSSVFVGIKETSAAGISYNLFPNPNHGTGTLTVVSESNGPLLIEITDVAGRLVYREEITTKAGQQVETKIDLQNSGKGIYMLKLTNSKGSTSDKIVVY